MSHADCKGKFGLPYPWGYIWISVLMTKAKVDNSEDFYTCDESFFISVNMCMTDW